MKPCRKLDGLIAEKIMGWQWGYLRTRSNLFPPEWIEIPLPFKPGYVGNPDYESERFQDGYVYPERAAPWQLPIIPYYSIRIEKAWEVVGKLRSQGWLVTVKEMPDSVPFWLTTDPAGAKVTARAACELQWIRTDVDADRRVHVNPWATGELAAHAICLAALQTVETTMGVAT